MASIFCKGCVGGLSSLKVLPQSPVRFSIRTLFQAFCDFDMFNLLPHFSTARGRTVGGPGPGPMGQANLSKSQSFGPYNCKYVDSWVNRYVDVWSENIKHVTALRMKFSMWKLSSHPVAYALTSVEIHI